MDAIIAGPIGKPSHDQIGELATPGIICCVLIWAFLRIRLAMRRKREQESKRPPDAP
jgi:hypothetical protein